MGVTDAYCCEPVRTSEHTSTTVGVETLLMYSTQGPVHTLRGSAAAAVQQRVLAAEAALRGGRSAAAIPRPSGLRAVALPGAGFAPAGPLRAGSLSSPRVRPPAETSV